MTGRLGHMATWQPTKVVCLIGWAELGRRDMKQIAFDGQRNNPGCEGHGEFSAFHLATNMISSTLLERQTTPHKHTLPS